MSFPADGHVLLEDITGAGKTSIFKSLAKSFHGNDKLKSHSNEIQKKFNFSFLNYYYLLLEKKS